MRRSLSGLQSAQIRRSAGEAVGYVVQNHALVHGRRTGLETKIEVLRLVEPLHGLEILRVQFCHVDEDVVIQFDAVLVLMGGAAVFGKGRKRPRLQRAVRGPAAAAPQKPL